jgi:hypothetical protein
MTQVLPSTATHYNQGARMNTDKGNSAESTNDKGYGMGSTSGIPASMPAGGQSMTTKGNMATFAHGKKTVKK